MGSIGFALVSFFGWAFGDIFGTIAARKLDSYSVTFWSYLLRILIFGFYIPFSFSSLRNITLLTLLLNLILGVVLLIGFVSFNESLRSTNPSLSGTITASFTALVVIFSLVFLKENLNLVQGIAILIIFLGLFLSIFNIKDLIHKRIKIDKGVMFAFLAMLMWGIYFTFVKLLVKQIGWFWPNYISFLFLPILFLFIKFKKFKLKKINHKKAFLPLLVAVFLTGIAEFSYNLGIGQGLTTVVASISGSYPSLFAILAYFVFKDPLTKQQKLAIPITLIGIGLLSFLN